MTEQSAALGLARRLGVAALGGVAVGIEREWSTRARAGPPRFAGVRTFFLLGLLGGLGGELYRSGPAAAAIAILAAACVLVLLAYAVSARAGDVDGTTEVSALVVLAAGVTAAMGRLQLASALFAITALVLVEKSRIHGLVYRLQSQVLEATARFAVPALVVQPLLPEGPYGPPPGIRPRELWILVLLFSGLSFAGFLALRALGPGPGYGLAGLFGGLVSSTAVTLSFSHESRRVPELGRALALGGSRPARSSPCGLACWPAPSTRRSASPRSASWCRSSPPASWRALRCFAEASRPARICGSPGTRCGSRLRSRWPCSSRQCCTW